MPSRQVCGACAMALAQLLLVASPATAQLTSLEAEGIRIVYFNGTESYLVPHAARTLLNSLAFQRRLFGLEPTEKITVLLVDFSDAGNASATVVPRDGVTVQIAPLSFAFETLAANERMNTIMNHELVHVATMDVPARSDRIFRGLFRGKVEPVAEHPVSMLYFYLTTPRVAAPRWYQEGSAVFVDTWMAGGLGRVQSGYDEMVFRAMVKDGSTFYDPLGLVSEGTKIDFQLQINSYLYGARFMTWLARHYSPEQLVVWLSRHDGSRGYYASQFRQVFGLSLEEAWSNWIADERAFQQKNLEAIRQNPLTSYRDVTARALGSVSRAYYDANTGQIYAAFNYPGVVAHVGMISLAGGGVEKIVDIKGPVIYTVTSLAYDPDTRRLFYTTDNNEHRDLMALDPATGRTEMLQKDARIGDLAFDRADRSIWGIRHLNGLCTLVRMTPPYHEWQQIVTWPYGTVMYDLDVSPDGMQVSASFGEINGHQDVRVFATQALLARDTSPLARFDFGTSVPSSFVFSPDGRYLYGSAYYTGVSNIYRYEIATGTVAAVSNTDTGFFRPVPMDGDSLLVFRYTGQGFVPTRIEARPTDNVEAITFLGERLATEHPIVKSWNVGSPAAIPFDSMPQRTEPYRLARNLRLESLYPMLQGYKDAAGVGIRLNFSDPVQLNRAALEAAWTPAGVPAPERIHLRAEYLRYDWRGRFELNHADFYDLFGPTKTSRKGYTVTLGHLSTLVFDEPRRLDFDLQGSFSGNLDRLPEYQNVAVAVDKLASFEAKLTYRDIRNSLGYVDDETGRRWSVFAHGDYVDGREVVRVHGTYDRGWALPAGHSSIWLRGAAGFSPRDPDDPFANFFFGAFGNNRIDRGEEKRYREYFSFPGAGLNEIGGRNFVKSTAEWSLPPLRFLHAGTPGFYLTWMRPALFAGVLGTNLDGSGGRRTAADAGVQLDFRFSAVSVLDLTLSVGGAVAVREGAPVGREAMVSLKALR